MEENVKWTRKVMSVGSSSVVALPTEIKDFLQISEGDEVILMPQNKGKGKFIALWKKE